jgi:UDP-N-acetylglucosamine--dolichyl-phosphate N-acetylglucosaminephosphotransferase
MVESSWALLALIEVIIASLVTYITTPFLIRILKANGVTGIDVHKIERPVRTEMCGLGAVFGFTIAYLTLTLLNGPTLKALAVVAVILFTSVIGVVDDLRGMRQRHKVILLLVAALPLAFAVQDRNSLTLPFIEPIFVGILYPALLVPVGISTASNLTNMLAGFNGLEAGIGSIALGSVAIVSLILGRWESFWIVLPMAIAFGTFLFYNWYPAKAFPGDAGTLVIGTTLGCAVIVGELEIFGIWVLIPHISDFLLKILGAQGRHFEQRNTFGDTQITSDGILHPPSYLALSHFLMNLIPMTEPQLVKALLTCEFFFASSAIAVSVWW